MFTYVEEFKDIYQKRMLERFGIGVPKSTTIERYEILGEMVRDYANKNMYKSQQLNSQNNDRTLIYFSMEFLIGRLLVNNLQNLGVYQVAKQGLEELGINIHELEEIESDAGLGNGGLGRLAACFLDSIASLGYIGHGNCIRYKYGFFKQTIVNGKQKELPDQWLSNGNVWEVRRSKYAVEVKFYGRPETYIKKDGTYGIHIVDPICVRAIPYDVPVVGAGSNVTNCLRLWDAEPSDKNLPKTISFNEYLNQIEELCYGLYPDDSTEHGRILRLRQQYFLVSSGLQNALNSYYNHNNKTLKGFHNSYVFQLNDTHPILAIPEMMRIMIDEYEMSWDDAWEEVTQCMAFTNHTIMPEALEKWPVQYVSNLVPRIYMIIEEINRRFTVEMNKMGLSDQVKNALAIIKDGQIHMTSLANYTCFSVNGVAAIHSNILKTNTFKEFYELFPNKFNNKTNGVTHRRWLYNANTGLSNLLNEKIGKSWVRDFKQIKKFEEFKDDADTLNKLGEVKLENKKRLAKYILDTTDIEVDVNSIFDVQIKRLHAYKRQLLNIFHVIYLYQRMKQDSSFRIYPRTFIFGAKAAPSYDYAKKIIELILAVAKVVNNDEETNKYLKVVFLENYGVTIAELIIPAADVSEQISTAGKEASGTSNMKLMMNGAVTLGTMDGANIEIVEEAGKENEVIFGLTCDEVEELYKTASYNPWDIYNSDSRVRGVMDSLFNGKWAENKPEKFRIIFDEIMNRNDSFFILKDFASYVEAQEKIEQLYKDKTTWNKMCLMNIAYSSKFTSDRTIEEYANEIWNLKKVNVNE